MGDEVRRWRQGDTQESRGRRRPPPMVLKTQSSLARGTLNSLCCLTHQSHLGALGVHVCANQRELNGKQASAGESLLPLSGRTGEEKKVNGMISNVILQYS